MKKFSWIFIMLCCTWLISCNKDDNEGGEDAPEGESFTLMNGNIVVNKGLDIKITDANSFPTGISTEAEFFGSRNRSGLKATAEGESADDLRGNDYRLKLIKEMATLDFEDGTKAQATHVKLEKVSNALYYAFVTYNEKGDGIHGGIAVFEVKINEGTLEKVSADVERISVANISACELSAVDYYNNKLYVTGATVNPAYGYSAVNDENRAVYMVFELENRRIKNAEPFVKMLTSYQGTSIRVTDKRAYVTTGDGTKNTQGGLYIFNTDDNTQTKFISDKDHARSVDADNAGIYLMQAEPARITKYDLEGSVGTEIYKETREALQKQAKSEILSWNNYLFVSENESGMRMLNKTGTSVINDMLVAPYTNEEMDKLGEAYVKENYVTNSIAMNSDTKKDSYGREINSNMLLLANGEKGIYWYDVMSTKDGKDRIVLCNANSISLGGSANFIASTGNIVFVADGLGGLKVLYIGFDNGAPPPPVGEACDDFMSYLFGVGDAKGLLPESKSVFTNSNSIITTLFANPADVIKYIEVEQETELFISYIGEWAGWKNSLGYFVIPATVPQTDAAELAYYNTKKSEIFTSVGSTYVLNDDYTIFKNISDESEGGPLLPASMYSIGKEKFKVGDRVVLFMAPNGWSSQNKRVEVSLKDWNQVFFTHSEINKGTKVYYPPIYNNFKGIQHNAFYSVACSSIVMLFEDNHSGGDVDYNDIVFSVTDNKDKVEISKIKLPKYAIVEESGSPVLKLTSELKK